MLLINLISQGGRTFPPIGLAPCRRRRIKSPGMIEQQDHQGKVGGGRGLLSPATEVDTQGRSRREGLWSRGRRAAETGHSEKWRHCVTYWSPFYAVPIGPRIYAILIGHELKGVLIGPKVVGGSDCSQILGGPDWSRILASPDLLWMVSGPDWSRILRGSSCPIF